ncbi:MFS transporter [Caulobacter sp. UNC279MFTsu5.1]|uniref:MFS transporter n=1 Tax=Caulobacter sp. UNC279MFTsu5.1 TaxID=1502775 RepID=UPI0003605367|nr:MFS transporter [Caulobacter sp. UNC279MFTsu5.1]SFI57182.1 Sugar phosphate permease [Caulobacter sp. UNC279MFTsu5.1]
MEFVKGGAEKSAYPKKRSAWLGAAVLTLACLLAFADRNIINLFIIPIQRDLGFSDTEISLLIGFAFGVFNAVFGLPVARWVDGGTRKLVAATGVAVWSLATAGCGLAGNFWQMFLARVVVGAGESAVMPCGVSLIADYFPPARRGAPMGVFYGGIFVGGGGAMLIGGLIWKHIGDRLVTVPLLGAIHSWQLILMILGAFGLAVVPLLLLLREPARLDGGRLVETSGVPIGVVARYYARHARTLVGHNLGFCLQNFVLHAGSAWLPTLLVRTQGWSIAQAGATFGLLTLALGPVGSIVAGLLADRFIKAGRLDGKLLVSIIASLICCACCVTVAFKPGAGVLVLALACFTFFGTFGLPLAPGALQDIMPNAMRGQAVAIYVGVTNLIAGGLAATTVALITEHVFHDKAKLNLSFGLVGTVATLLAALLLAGTLSAYRRTVAELSQAAQAA